VDDLEKICGFTKQVTVRNHEITVREVNMKTLGKFTAACGPFLSAFDEAGDLAERNGKPAEAFMLLKVVAENTDAFMAAASLVTNAPVEFYEQLSPVEFFEVAAAVVEVNGSFFVHSLAPTLVKFARGISLIGSTLYNGLSPEDTAA
jgi:hypothetical protein